VVTERTPRRAAVVRRVSQDMVKNRAVINPVESMKVILDNALIYYIPAAPVH
jgi:hypothetical protein